MGGTLEAPSLAPGDNDLCEIVDLPDNVTVSAASLVINVSGAVELKTVVLLTPKEVDQAVKEAVKYTPPVQ